jgi:hypothetical protein
MTPLMPCVRSSLTESPPRRKTLVLAKYGEWESIVGGIIDWIAPDVRFLADHRTESLAVVVKEIDDHFPGAPQGSLSRRAERIPIAYLKSQNGCFRSLGSLRYGSLCLTA